MAPSKGTFNEYLFTVDKLRERGLSRPDAHWKSINAHWHEMADKVKGTNRDPRRMRDYEIDSWLGWLVAEWNRVS